LRSVWREILIARNPPVRSSCLAVAWWSRRQSAIGYFLLSTLSFASSIAAPELSASAQRLLSGGDAAAGDLADMAVRGPAQPSRLTVASCASIEGIIYCVSARHGGD